MPRRITYLLIKLAFSRSVNSAITSSILEKAMHFFTMIIFEQGKKKIRKINEEEQLEITLFVFWKSSSEEKGHLCFVLLPEAQLPFHQQSTVYFFYKNELWNIEQFPLQIFIIKELPWRPAAVAIDLGKPGILQRSFFRLLVVTSWTHFALYFYYIFSFWLSLTLQFFQKILTCFEDVSSSAT